MSNESCCFGHAATDQWYTGAEGEVGGLQNGAALSLLLPNQGPQWELGGTVVYQHFRWPHCSEEEAPRKDAPATASRAAIARRACSRPLSVSVRSGYGSFFVRGGMRRVSLASSLGPRLALFLPFVHEGLFSSCLC